MSFGILVSSELHKEPERVVGVPMLAAGASVVRNNILYCSVQEAIHREGRGEPNVTVEIHASQRSIDDLESLRVKARARWDNDTLTDGWTRPTEYVPPVAKVKPLTNKR